MLRASVEAPGSRTSMAAVALAIAPAPDGSAEPPSIDQSDWVAERLDGKRGQRATVEPWSDYEDFDRGGGFCFIPTPTP